MTIDIFGNKSWRINGLLHRTNGPAIELPCGTKVWYLNGFRHRTTGPAYEGSDGYKSWFINGIHYSEQQFLSYILPNSIHIHPI
jgi:hypothetical protein